MEFQNYQIISSKRNPIVRRLRDLSNSKVRNQLDLLIVEGSHLVLEAIHLGLKPLEIIATKKWTLSHQEILSSMKHSFQFNLVTEEVLKASLTTITPNGVAAIINISSLPRAKSDFDLVVALDRLQDPGNVGNIFRTALAAEVDEIWTSNGADPLSQKVLRASAGSIFQMPFFRISGSEDQVIDAMCGKLKDASSNGFQVIATAVPTDKDRLPLLPYWDLDWQRPTVVVFGNEGGGLHAKIRSCCTHFVTLPHGNNLQSLNVSAVAVPLLLERKRAQMTFANTKK